VRNSVRFELPKVSFTVRGKNRGYRPVGVHDDCVGVDEWSIQNARHAFSYSGFARRGRPNENHQGPEPRVVVSHDRRQPPL
jgi:hypothetical protein